MQRNALAYDYDLTLDQEPGDTIQWFNGVPVRLHKVGENVNLLKVWGGVSFFHYWDKAKNNMVFGAARVYDQIGFRAVRKAFPRLPFGKNGLNQIEFSGIYTDNCTDAEALALLSNHPTLAELTEWGINTPSWLKP